MIRSLISDRELLDEMRSRRLRRGFGVGIDERIVEYPWVVSHMQSGYPRTLDAGSTFNHDFVIHSLARRTDDLTIYTYYPESSSFLASRVSYGFGDLREMPYRDAWFDLVLCVSTLEHIDMDGSIYGYEAGKASTEGPSYEYLRAVRELVRVLSPGGLLLITIPFGRYERHDFFQQFDVSMVARLASLLPEAEIDFVKYTSAGWCFSSQDECADAASFNPHSGAGRGSDGAAHSRALCLIRYRK